jgi:hypothetical protein
MDLASIGLLVIALAWIVQLVYTFKSKEIQPVFIILYIIGVLVLVTSIYLQSKVISYYEVFTVITSALVLGKLYWRKKK